MEAITSGSNNDDALIVITSMGFDISQAQSALNIASGNVEYAINYLLTGEGINDGGESNGNQTLSHSANQGLPMHESTTIEQIQGSTSQYSYEYGRSACSFIALTAASTILNDTKGISITESLLDDNIKNGCSTYSQWKSTYQRDDYVEHTSVDEILQCGYYSGLELLPGGIRQGMLSIDKNGPLSVHTLLLDCQSSTEWICVVMIKPPETILLLLPPSASTSSNNGNMNRYFLLDSHPRMMEFGAENAYCRIHITLLDLVESVSKIFPIADLGPDVPEYMSSMYTSFDLYALRIVSKDA